MPWSKLTALKILRSFVFAFTVGAFILFFLNKIRN